MISQGEVKRRYDKLLRDVAMKIFYKVDLTNRVNCYACGNCKHVTKTKDIDAGVTPFFFTCENCGNWMAESTFYIDIVPDQQPTFEWYRPTLKETTKMRKNTGLLEHILGGGLQYRKILNSN